MNNKPQLSQKQLAYMCWFVLIATVTIMSGACVGIFTLLINK